MFSQSSDLTGGLNILNISGSPRARHRSLSDSRAHEPRSLRQNGSSSPHAPPRRRERTSSRRLLGWAGGGPGAADEDAEAAGAAGETGAAWAAGSGERTAGTPPRHVAKDKGSTFQIVDRYV